MAALYPWLKLLHVTCVLLSVTLLVLRGWWHWRDSPRRHGSWAMRVPHVNDTVLLLAGLALAATLGQYPFTAAWLTAKLAGLVVHVVLGVLAFRGPLRGRGRGAAFAGSLAAFGYVVAVALTRDVTPWG